QVRDAEGDPLLFGRRNSREGTMTAGHGPVPFSDVCAAALAYQKAQQRRRGYYGDFYYAIPARNRLHVLDRGGRPAPGARVTAWQSNNENELRDPPLFQATAGPDGLLDLPNLPAPRVT